MANAQKKTTTPVVKKSTEKAPKAKKQRTRFAIRLVNPKDPNENLVVVTRIVAANDFRTQAIHVKLSDELTPKGKQKKVRERGASQIHKDAASAKSAVDAILQMAAKQGWVKKAKTVRVRADSFSISTIPAPALVKK